MTAHPPTLRHREPTAQAGGSGWRSLIPQALMGSSLMRNGYALIANSGLSAVLGLAFWFLAARYCSQEAIGLGGAITATIVNLSNAAQLNFGNLLVRFVPTVGGRAGRLILFAYATSFIASVVVAIVFLLVVGAFMPKLDVLTESAGVILWFVATVAVWSVFALQDSALSGLRQSIWVPVSKTIYQVVKIAMLIPLALAGLGWEAIALSWTAPVLVFVLAVNMLIFKRLVPKAQAGTGHANLIDRRAMARFFGWDYIGSVSMMVAWTATPLVVLNFVGAAESASFFVAWTIFTSLYYVGSSMGLSLLAEGASDTGRLRALAADAAVMSVLPLLGLVALMLVFAHPIMSVFGAAYATEGAAILRVFTLASVVSAVLSIYLSIARTKGWMRSVAAAEVATLVIALGAGALLVRSEGPIGMAHAWLLAMLVVTFGVGALALVTSRRHSMHDWGLAVAASLKSLSAQFLPFGRNKGIAVPGDAELRPLLAKTGSSAASGWHALKSEHGPEGTDIVYLGDPVLEEAVRHAPVRSQGTYAVLRSARNPIAAAYLERLVDNLDLLHADTRLQPLWPMLPTRLSVTRIGGAVDCIEAMAPGTDGRVLLRDASERQTGLEAAAKAVAILHGQTAAMRTIDDVWFHEWVERPAAKLAQLGGSTMLAAARRRAIERFVGQQRRYWLGRQVRLGWCHGDLWPQNLNFASGQGSAARLASLLEWGNARSNAPRGFDGCVLAVAMRMMTSSEPLGAAVADLLWTPEWRNDERQWLGIGSDGDDDWSGDGAAIRAMVGLVWLHQVSERARRPAHSGVGRLWIASNVDRVLRIVSTDGGAI
ncbi:MULTISPECIES: phosphotransferase [Aminobacter]|uniref:O-antigen/teichoic acid export membrane protein n=3 Tax=Aminobacter TaxID=31988 RepID=A0ABR6H005_AMIAI|nr:MULTISPECIES: phosphotransferase [Aminobacter]MBA8904309.1 O-antigen/teichoic acid export membrane protein [Aminobacter ciceronei]MBA9018087.1 O-antigen/teichoic acid export membrane protein [Aminobacter ciceronei]MBB3704020.1 O-antigen/teichoic acid export membrane protein [Aminobacter aminovorans]